MRYTRTSPSEQARKQRVADARAKGTHTREQWSRLEDFCGRQFVRCGARRPDGYVEKDHIVPLYQGGSDAIGNIQPLCARCNASKGKEVVDHRPSGWREAVFGDDA